MKRGNNLVLQAIFGMGEDPKKIAVNTVLVILTALWSIGYSIGIIILSPYHNIFTGLFYVLKYIPFILGAAFGGAVPGLMAVLIVFFQKSVAYSSFSYLTFIYLVVAIAVDGMAKKKFFKKWYTTVAASLIVMFIAGVFWGVVLWLLSGKALSTIDLFVIANCFLNEIPGSFISCFIVYNVFKKLPPEKLRLFGNGKYYMDPELLTEEERYEIGGRSKIGRVILGIVVLPQRWRPIHWFPL